MFDLTYIAIIIFVASFINIIATYVSWQRRNTREGQYFAWGMVGVTIWTLASGLDYAAVPIPLKVFFAKWEVVGYSSALTLFVLFTLSHAGYEEWLSRKWVKGLLIFIPFSNNLLVWTNEWHHWVWTDFERNAFADNVVIFQHGPGFLWVTTTGYLMILTILIQLWLATRQGPEISRRQSRYLFWAALFPLAANVIYLSGLDGVQGVDWTSVTFSVTGLIFLYSLHGAQLLDIVPIARDKLVNGLSDGMIVLDLQNRIIDVNHVAASVLGREESMLIGKEIFDIVPRTRSFLEQPVDQEIKMELDAGVTHKRYFDVLLSPLREGNGKVIGRLMIFRDITTRKENELRLLQLSQAVSQSPASVLITDLKGNIEYVNPHFSLLTGYSYAEVIGQNPSLLKSGHTSDDVYRNMWETIAAGATWSGEFLNKKKNDELYWEYAVISPVLGGDGQILNFIAVKVDITARKQAEASLERRFLEIQELHKNLQETQSQLVEQQRTLAALDERRRLGRNMHDSVNQSIHSLMLFSETLVALLEKNDTEKAMYIAERILQSGTQALKEIRLLVYETQSLPFDRNTDLVSVLEERLNMVERRIGIRAELVCHNIGQYPREWNENLYWMITEALNNSLKHARARTVTVVIECKENKLDMDVSDDGVGLELSRMKPGGFGMSILCERAETLGGLVTVQSSPGQGMQVHFTANLGA